MRLYGSEARRRVLLARGETARFDAAGFTLIELMMVVAILGILAVIAIPRYKAYLYRSKTAEAIGFLAEIKSRQESYRADFGQYCAVNPDSSAWYPAARTNGMFLWDAAPTTGAGGNFRQLGAYPPSQQSLFQYQVIAGPPGAGNVPPNVPGYTGADFWFVSRARADLDNDGISVTFEGYSASSGVWISNAAGWE